MTRLSSSIFPSTSIPAELLIQQDNLRSLQLLLSEAVGGKLSMIDGIVDSFEDTTGINTAFSRAESTPTSGAYYLNNSLIIGSSSTYTTPAFTASNAISGGVSVSNVASNAFDGSNTTFWASSQVDSGVSGIAWIGMDFGAGNAYYVNAFSIFTYSSTAKSITSVLLQYSDNGTSWTSLGSAVTIVTTVSTSATYNASTSPSAPHRYWRLLANANISGTSNNSWYMPELRFLVSNTFANRCIDLSTGPISGGYLNSGVIPPYAFDGTSNSWGSSQTGSGVNGVAWIGYDYGPGNSYVVDAFFITQSGTSTLNITSVLLQYSDDGSTWTTLGSAYTLSTTVNSTATFLTSGATAHRFWRLLANASIAATYFWCLTELAFYQLVLPGSYACMSVYSNVFNTPVSSPSTGRLSVQFDKQTNATFNASTDIVAYISRDGGTTFTTAAMTFDTFLNSTGNYMIESNDVDLTSLGTGSSMIYKLLFVTLKQIFVSGVIFQWRP